MHAAGGDPSATHKHVSAGCRVGTWVPVDEEKLGQLQAAPLCPRLLSQVQTVFLAVIRGSVS